MRVLTPCLGRDLVQQRLGAALTSARWVSVVGPPGSGKSLLLRHACADRADTAWVDARGMSKVDDVLAACVEALAAELAPGDRDEAALGRALDDSKALLVVDGVDADPDRIGPLFQSVVEATSEARLAVTALTMAGQPGERVVRVGPLPVPGPGEPLAGPAVELLTSRVVDAGGHPLDLAADEAGVRRLLAATGGLPLVIEQVAVQVALVGVGNVEPVASLADAVQASYDLLDEDQQRCFRRLAQLSSPVSIDVLGDITGVDRARASELAAGLARRSLLEVLPDGRFDMLSPVRRHGNLLCATTDDAEQVRAGVLAWADRVAPHHLNFGAADQPWLLDLPVMRGAILTACADPATRGTGYDLANRIFSSLYTSMRARDAVEILEGALVSGDGPATIGAQVARRAGIAASEVRGSYEGLWLLDRADQHAAGAPDPDAEQAKTASIRAEMHLDAGDLRRAEQEAQRAIELDRVGGSIIRQATRTLADVYVSSGRFAEAQQAAISVMPGTDANNERWITLSARTLLARVALEQGRVAEAVAVTRAVVTEARELAEDRVGLLAETLLRDLDRSWDPAPVDRESLPWAVRLPVLAQDARERLAGGEARLAAGQAADVVALADGARLGRDAVEARLLLGRALLACGDVEQATTTFLTAMEQAAAMPMPLRVADALDGLASMADQQGRTEAGQIAATADAIRAPRLAAAWGYAARFPVAPGRRPPRGWVHDGELTADGLRAIVAAFAQGPAGHGSPLDVLTAAERQIAEGVARGLTSRKIGEELFVSPRTVDAHLTHIYRKLDINTRSRLAAMVVNSR